MTIDGSTQDDDGHVGSRSILMTELRRVLLELESRGAIGSATAFMAETALGMSRQSNADAQTAYLTSTLSLHAKHLQSLQLQYFDVQARDVLLWIVILGFMAAILVKEKGGLDLQGIWNGIRIWG